jgi:hypothetical protein
MSKKLYFPIVLALLLSLFAGVFASGAASAAPGGPGQRIRQLGRGLAQITEIGDQQITVQRLKGEAVLVRVDENTRYTNRDKEELSFEALQVGQWVRVLPLRDESGAQPGDGEVTAKAIIILPEDFDPEDFSGAGGKVTAIDLAAGEFSLENKEGETLTYATSQETRFAGSLEGLADLELEMVVLVAAEEQADGSLLARVVGSRTPMEKAAGEITAVGADSLTLKLRRSGEEITFKVDENTRFRSKGGELDGLEDVEVGMVGMVMAARQADGDASAARLASAVLLADKEQLPQFDLRLGGKVTDVNGGSFTVENKKGQQYTFTVSADATFRSRQGQVQGVEDIEVGMVLLVGADQLPDGSYQAGLVVVMKLAAVQ